MNSSTRHDSGAARGARVKRDAIVRGHTLFGMFAVAAGLTLPSAAAAQTMAMQDRLSRFADQRFGMFIHYNMNTYVSGWAENRVDPKTFAPPNGDCHTFTDQWAKAAKSAGMKFGILTTKHHDGFSIWPSKAAPPSTSPYGKTPYTIAQSSVPTMDVVKCYTDSFRAQGLDPNLYFSIWDPNSGVGSQAGHNTDPGPVDWNVVGEYITTQITELLTNYGEIPMFVFDGYEWLTGHQQVPFEKIRALVHQLQPNTIVMDHNGGVPWEVDTVYFEEPLGVTVPTGNTVAGAQGQTIAKNQDWFWDSGQTGAGYLSATDIANELAHTEPNYTSFVLDCPPNPQGLLDNQVVTILGQVASAWTPNVSRPSLPAQPARILTPYTAVGATATSGSAALAVDGYNDSAAGVNNTLHSSKGESLWTSTGPLPQSITLDLGAPRSGIDMVEVLPQRHTGTTNGNITSYRVLVSTDGTSFTEVTRGTWPASSITNALLAPESARFAAQTARYVRLEADAVAGGGTAVIAGEVAAGSIEEYPSPGTDGGTALADAGDSASESGGTLADGGDGGADGSLAGENAGRPSDGGDGGTDGNLAGVDAGRPSDGGDGGADGSLAGEDADRPSDGGGTAASDGSNPSGGGGGADGSLAGVEAGRPGDGGSSAGNGGLDSSGCACSLGARGGPSGSVLGWGLAALLVGIGRLRGTLRPWRQKRLRA